jgi:hypothetical protein
VWTSIYRWLGFEGAYAATAVDHFMQHGEMFIGKKWKKTRHLVWLYFIGSYGSLGTNVFERKVPCQNVVILNIKCLSLSWFMLKNMSWFQYQTFI